jgi:hypothetical protein
VLRRWWWWIVVVVVVAASKAVEMQICNRGIMLAMLAKIKNGHSINQDAARASDDLEGFSR